MLQRGVERHGTQYMRSSLWHRRCEGSRWGWGSLQRPWWWSRGRGLGGAGGLEDRKTAAAGTSLTPRTGCRLLRRIVHLVCVIEDAANHWLMRERTRWRSHS